MDDERTRARKAWLGTSVAGRYRLVELLGSGGMGAVYAAETPDGGEVAVKLIDAALAKNVQTVARFAREAQAMGAIASPHIARVLEVGTEEGLPWIAMERLHGEDLGARLAREHRLEVGVALGLIAQVLDGLAAAHAAGIVHRDLKPDNVFVVDDGTAKLLDFGVSKIERPGDRTIPLALTGRGTVLGTPFYVSPEQAQAKADLDGRADLWSVGAILFECLTGRPPHTGETHEQVLVSICLHDAPDIRSVDPSIPAPVAAIVRRALARDPAERFPSAAAMLAALPGRSRSTPLWLLGVLALVSLALGVVATALVLRYWGR